MSGCAGGGALNVLPDPTYRFVNASVDSTLNVSLNDVDVATGVAYLGSTPNFASVEYRSESDGGYDATVYVPGTETEVRNYQEWSRDAEYIWVAYGLRNYGTEQTKRLDQLHFRVDRDAPVGNRARLVIFNALVERDGVDPYAVDFRSYDPTNPAGSENPQFSKGNLAFGSFDSNSNVLDIDSGTLTFQARQSAADAAVIYAQKTYTFSPGGVYLALVSGKVGSTTTPPTITYVQL